MPATTGEIQNIAKNIQTVARAIKTAKSQIDTVLRTNAAHAIDWTSQAAKDALEENTPNPSDYSAAEVSNVIGSLDTFNTAHWDAGHGGNYEMLLGKDPL